MIHMPRCCCTLVKTPARYRETPLGPIGGSWAFERPKTMNFTYFPDSWLCSMQSCVCNKGMYLTPTLVKLGAFLHWGNRGFWCVLYPWAPNSEQRGLKSDWFINRIMQPKDSFFFQNPDQGNHATKRLRWKIIHIFTNRMIHNKIRAEAWTPLTKRSRITKKKAIENMNRTKIYTSCWFFFPYKNRRFFVGSSFFSPLDQDPSHGWDTFMDPKQNFDGSGGYKAAEVTRRFLFSVFFLCQKKGRTFLKLVDLVYIEGSFVSFSFGGREGGGLFV